MSIFGCLLFAFVAVLVPRGRGFLFGAGGGGGLPLRDTSLLPGRDGSSTSSNHVLALGRIPRTKRRIPKYMLKLYEELTTREGLLKQGMPYNVNAIRGIYSKRITTLSSTSMEIFYDIGYLHDVFAARRDEIHLYMDLLKPQDPDIFKPYVLRIHDIYTGRLIRQYKVPAFNYGWQVLSLSGWTTRWVRQPLTNKGMRLTVYRGRRGSQLAPRNPFISYAVDKDPYLILFGDDSTDSISTWRFLSGFPLNSVAGSAARRQRRMASSSRDMPRCEATETSVHIKGRKIDDQHIIVQPESYKMIECSGACVTTGPGTSEALGLPQPPGNYCCVASRLRSMGFLVTEPSRNTVTFASVPNMLSDGCQWTLQ